jgi:hypothetical protein
MNHRIPGLVLILVLSAACVREPPPPVELQVGGQRFSVVIPEGWERLDYGDIHHFRRGIDRISIEEAGGAPDKALRRLGEYERRDIASRTPIQIGSQEGLIVDTWDRLSHQYRKRFCFVQGNGPLLVVYMKQGRFEDLQPDFDALVASIAFADSTTQAVGDSQPQ